MVRGRTFPLLFVGLAMTLISGCGTGHDDAVRAVRAYDEALIRAYRASDISALKAVATEAEVKRLFVLIDLKRSNGLVLESTLEGLRVISEQKSGEKAMVVETRERWRYYDRPLEPGRQLGQVFVADMSMRYHLVLDEENWKVDHGETLSSTYLEPRGFAPGKNHGS